MRTQLWAPSDAARSLGVSLRTAQRRAQEAMRAGDPSVQRVGTVLVASEVWWRGAIPAPRPRGRPRLSKRVE